MTRRHASSLARPLFAALVAILLAPAEGLAQNRSGGLGGGSSLGTSSFGGSGFGASSFGSSSFGSSSFGSSGFGGSGFGGSGGSSFGQSGFGGTNASGAATFVGRGAETLFVGRGAGLQQLNTNTGQTRSSRSGGNKGSGSSDTRRPEVRVRLVASPELLASVARPKLDPRSVTRLRNRSGLAGVSISNVDGVTRLEGVVATDSQRRLAEKLLAIEPGVGPIDNRLQLAATVEEIPPAPR